MERIFGTARFRATRMNENGMPELSATAAIASRRLPLSDIFILGIPSPPAEEWCLVKTAAASRQLPGRPYGSRMNA